MNNDDRIRELEDLLRHRDRRMEELKRERDAADKLVADMVDQIEASNEMIDQWIDTFDMVQNESGTWVWNGWEQKASEGWKAFQELREKWNKIVARYNNVVAPRNFGRPLAASAGQQAKVLKLLKDGQSLRAIADETNLSLRTIRTIVDKKDGVDRATVKRLQRIAPDKLAEARERRLRRLRASLPKKITETRKRGADLLKAAKGLR